MSGCILCGIHDSAGDRGAAAVASRLARDLHSHAVILHVNAGARAVPHGLRPPRVGRDRKLRRQLRTVAEEQCFPEGTDLRVEAGDPVTRLIAVAEAEDAELIVVAARGPRGGAVLIPWVASALLTGAPCPVVLVPQTATAPLDSASMRDVICGIEADGSERDRAVLRLASDLAGRLGGELHAVHGYDPAAAPASAPGPQHKLNDALGESGVDAHGRVVPLAPAEALERIAVEQRAGLIVVGAQGAGTADAALHGPVPIQLATAGSTAVLVLPHEAALEAGSGHYELAAGTA